MACRLGRAELALHSGIRYSACHVALSRACDGKVLDAAKLWGCHCGRKQCSAMATQKVPVPVCLALHTLLVEPSFEILFVLDGCLLAVMLSVPL